jgi:TonB family protein
VLGCTGGGPDSGPDSTSVALRQSDVPVAINGESPFQYPAELYDQGVEGEVRLRLYVDSAGVVHPESTRVASSSGTPALDTAAVRGAAQLRFAPAHRRGVSVGMTFYQPVIFRRRPAAGPGTAN